MWVCIQVVMAANNPMGVDKEQVGAFILFHFPFFFFMLIMVLRKRIWSNVSIKVWKVISSNFEAPFILFQ